MSLKKKSILIVSSHSFLLIIIKSQKVVRRTWRVGGGWFGGVRPVLLPSASCAISVARCFMRNLIVACSSKAEQSNLHGLLLLFSVDNNSDTGLVSFCQILLWVIVDVLVTTNNYFAIMIYLFLATEQKFTWVLPVLLQTHHSVGYSTFQEWLFQQKRITC